MYSIITSKRNSAIASTGVNGDPVAPVDDIFPVKFRGMGWAPRVTSFVDLTVEVWIPNSRSPHLLACTVSH